MPKYRLTYFPVRGRAELIRLIFAAGGQEYEDRRVQLYTEPDFSKAMAMKEEDRKFSEEWLEVKAKVPFGQLPILEVDGHTIAQTKVIAAFLGRRLGLAGKTDVDDAGAAMITETIIELFVDPISRLFYEKDKEKQAEGVKKYVSETLPNMLARLEKRVGGKGYFVADQLSYADIALYTSSFQPSLLKVEIDWAKYPKLKSVYDNVTKNSGIAKWLKERPQTLL